LFLFTAHSAAVQWNAWRGQRAMATLQIGDEVWVAGNDWWARASAEKRRQVEAAVRSLEWTTEYGLAGTPAVLQDLVWLYLAKARVQDAERTVRQLLENTPETAEPYRGLANILRMTGRNREAEEQYRLALAVDASHARALEELASLLSAQGRVDDAKRELRRLVEGGQAPATTWSTLGLLEIRSGESDVGIQRLGRALELDPQLFQTRYQLAAALLSRADGPGGRAAIDEAITHLRMVISERPQFAEAHYNLGVAEFMSGQFEDALNHVREALRLNPSDVQAKQFLQVVEESYKSSRGD